MPNSVNVAALSDQDLDRVIEMAWEDRTSFEAIHYQFGLSEAQVIALMRAELIAIARILPKIHLAVLRPPLHAIVEIDNCAIIRSPEHSR